MACAGDKCHFKYYAIWVRDLRVSVKPLHGCPAKKPEDPKIYEAIINQVKIDQGLPDWPKQYLDPQCAPPPAPVPPPPAPQTCDCVPIKDQDLKWSPWSPYTITPTTVDIGKMQGGSAPCQYTVTGLYYLASVVVEGTCQTKPDKDNWKPPEKKKTPEEEKGEGLEKEKEGEKQIVPPKKKK